MPARFSPRAALIAASAALTGATLWASQTAPSPSMQPSAQAIEFFEARGLRKGRQRVDRWATTLDGRTLISGVVHNPSGDLVASFVSELVLEADGRISWYAGYSSRPAVGATIPG